MTLLGGVGERFAQNVTVPSYGGGGWPNRHVIFVVAENIQFTVPLTLFTVWGGGKNGLPENVRIPSYVIWEEGSKFA